MQRGDERLQHFGAELAGQDADRRRAPRRQCDRRCGRAGVGARSAIVRRVARRVDGGEEPASRAGDIADVAVELTLERPRHSHAVFMHREPVVSFGGRERAIGHHVVLVGGVDDPSAEGHEVHVLPVLDGVDHGARFLARVHAQVGLRVEAGDPQRDDGNGRQLRVLVEDARERVVEPCPVVDTGTDDDLAADLDAVVEEGAQPAQARRSPAVAQHRRPQVGIGRVDRDVEGRQALGHDSFEVGLGEPGQRREVAVEEAQPVVVVLEVEALAHALGQLVDEAELAVVVAGADAVEHGAGDLGAEGNAGRLGDGDLDLDAVPREHAGRRRTRPTTAATR